MSSDLNDSIASKGFVSDCHQARITRYPKDTPQGNGSTIPVWFDWCTECGEKCRRILSKDSVMHSKRIDSVRAKLNDAHDAGEIPYSMDDEQDRERMARWIVDNILPI